VRSRPTRRWSAWPGPVYLDTSALLKLYFPEPLSEELQAALGGRTDLFVSDLVLTEAASALGITEATARTHRNHIFTKTGVSRRTDLLALVGRLVPPIRRPR
jgi:predicted nucleic acid-binding protein